jgi:hypothetical protein
MKPPTHKRSMGEIYYKEAVKTILIFILKKITERKK